MDIKKIIRECKIILANHYGAQLKGLILYGSTARGQSSPGSDIDILVLLNPPFNFFTELHQIIELLYPLQLESEQLISAKPASITEFQIGKLQLYRNIKREGIAM